MLLNRIKYIIYIFVYLLFIFLYLFIKICQRAVYSSLFNDNKNISNNHDNTVGWNMTADM